MAHGSSQGSEMLARFVQLYRQFDVVDLGATLENGIPRWPTHPPLIVHATVTHEHDGYFTNTLFLPEHIGTHCDSPSHVHADMGEHTIDRIPVEQMIGQACVLDVSHLGLKAGERVGEDTVLAWEAEHGPIQAGDIAIFNFGWLAKHWRTDGRWREYAENSPGLSEGAVRLLYERGIKALGSDLIACDQPVINGKALPSYSHDRYLLPNGIPLIESLTNLEKLTPRCFVVVLPLKIAGGSGSPLRPVAFVPRQG